MLFAKGPTAVERVSMQQPDTLIKPTGIKTTCFTPDLTPGFG